MGDRELDEIEQRVADGETVADIARSMSITPRTVRNRFAAAGRPSPTRRRTELRRSRLADPDWLAECLRRGWSNARIAAESSSSRDDVLDAIATHSLKRPHEQAILDAFDAGLGIRGISRTVGCSTPTVRKVLAEHDHHWTPTHAPRPAELDDPILLHRWYRTQRLPISTIAQRLDITAITVRNALERHDIAIDRSRPPAHPRLEDRRWLAH